MIPRWLPALLALGCGEAPLSRAELLDPQSCADCHPDTVREWSGSMHAYASVDPIFRAIDARGQREAALGDFCVRCHAPSALREGLVRDGSGLASVPAHLQGVTCVFCHEIDGVTGEHNAAVSVADDGVMRGGLDDPIDTPAHAMSYSPLHDRRRLESSRLCGACHDVVTPSGLHLERGFLEWKGSLFSSPDSLERVSCQGCHMQGEDAQVAHVEGAPVRRRKSHTFAAIDRALVPFPELEDQRARVARELGSTLLASLCVYPGASGATVAVTLENVGAGHHFPSGVADRRQVWLELVATRGGQTVFESGVDGPRAPDAWWFGEHALKLDGSEALMPWEVARVESNVLPAPTTRDPSDPRFSATHRTRGFFIPAPTPERIRMRVRLFPIARSVLDSLVATGDLDPEVVARMEVEDLASTVQEWRASDGELCANAR